MGPNAATNAPLETLDFDSGGYFSTYNWELFFHAPLLIAKRLSVAQRFGEAKTGGICLQSRRPFQRSGAS